MHKTGLWKKTAQNRMQINSKWMQLEFSDCIISSQLQVSENRFVLVKFKVDKKLIVDKKT